jgi:hypothetical protein
VRFLGFLLPVALMALLAVVYEGRYFGGWQGGDYAHVFIGIAAGAVLVGGGLKLFSPRWGSFGLGMVLGGMLSPVITFMGVVLFMAVVSQSKSGF